MSNNKKKGGNDMQYIHPINRPFIVPAGARPKKTIASKENTRTINFIKKSMTKSSNGEVTFHSLNKKK